MLVQLHQIVSSTLSCLILEAPRSEQDTWRLQKTTRARDQETFICLFAEESRKGVWVYKPKVISKRFCWVYISWFSESPGNASFVALGVRTGQKPKLCTLLAAVHMSGALKISCADTHSPAFGPFPSRNGQLTQNVP